MKYQITIAEVIWFSGRPKDKNILNKPSNQTHIMVTSTNTNTQEK